MAIRSIVFVEPPYVFWDRSMDRLREREESIPGMGMLVLASVARERGYDAAIVDAKGTGDTVEAVTERILRAKPDVVGFSATTISITNAARIAEELKRIDERIVTVVGGPHVSAIPERTLAAFPSLDYGIVGEGEISFFDFLARLDKGEDVSGCAGLVRRDADGTVHANERTPYIEDLDALPLPAWDLVADFPHKFRPSLLTYRTSPVATLVTSRGCPFTCSFCDRSTSGKLGRYQ